MRLAPTVPGIGWTRLWFLFVLLWGGSLPPLTHSAEPPPPLQPTLADVAYGPDERTKLDLYQAQVDGPRPLLMFIHGGGWTAGDKRERLPDLRPFLQRGISIAAINYRLCPKHPLPAPVHDAARSLQFLRARAAEFQINPQRVAAMGQSAGACTSMWLLLHDDLADPDSPDPVARQSTRLVAAVAFAGQTSIESRELEQWLGPQVLQHRMLWLSVGEPTLASALAKSDRHRPVFREFSPIHHVDRDDPPLLMIYSTDAALPARDASHGIHHPQLGVRLKAESDRCGHVCHLRFPGQPDPASVPDPTEFLCDKLLAP